ncbi:MAG: formylglycine-generating enzyme family protein, partial [Spirochaetota bacterium]
RTDDALPDYRDAFGRDEVQYKERVAGAVDGRSMVFVRGGVTLIGSDVGGKDETPLHTQIVDSFYIDVYEVTNRDYLVYVMEGGGSTPRAWKSGAFPAGKADHPVMVTYYEASGYARWAGKRLPTEFEWERAANGVIASRKTVTDDGMVENPYKTRYPWGNDITFQTNYSALWDDTEAMTQYTYIKRGTLPVQQFESTDVSYYGAVHMAGNIGEWTSSWYRAYEGSRYTDIRYGTQVKVIRGGSWFSSAEECTVSARSYGGLPNLESDASAGFRCVRDVDANDRAGE